MVNRRAATDAPTSSSSVRTFEIGVAGASSASIDRTSGMIAVGAAVVCTTKCAGVIPPPL